MTYESVIYETEGRVATVTLNRPEKLNAISPRMQSELIAALSEAEADKGIHVAVVEGAGRAFCTGYDISGGGTAGGGGITGDRDWLERTMRGWLQIWDMRLAIVAKVHGYCLAGGTQLATFCDITFVSDDCKIGTPELPLGAGYVGAAWTWLVGPKKAKEMFFPSGEMISGAEATEWGLFNRSVPADQLDEAVADYVAKVARTPKEIIALQKQSVNRIQEIQGFRDAMMQAIEVDAIAHASTPVRAINKHIREHGLQDALRAFRADEIP